MLLGEQLGWTRIGLPYVYVDAVDDNDDATSNGKFNWSNEN